MKLHYLNIGGEKRPACFSLSAVEEIEDEFGSLDKMVEDLNKGKVKTVGKVLDIMLKAGTAYCAGMGIECPPPLKCRAADIIDVTDADVIKEIFSVMNGDAERTVEVKGKN